MRTVTINVLQFNELDEKAKAKAREWGHDLNVDFNWWADLYEDARMIDLKIDGFDIDHCKFCNGHFIAGALSTAQKIQASHGEKCETYKAAVRYLYDWDKLCIRRKNGEDLYYTGNKSEGQAIMDNVDTEAEDLDNGFKSSLLAEYLKMLRIDYDYRVSEKAIDEAIIANEYEFTDEGERYVDKKPRLEQV